MIVASNIVTGDVAFSTGGMGDLRPRRRLRVLRRGGIRRRSLRMGVV